DDDGKSYTVQAGNSWGSTYPINPLSDVKYSYNYYIGATIDYLYVYDSAYEGKVNVTYNDGLALDGAEDIIAGEALTVNAEFDDAITAADLEKITVAGATVSGVLSDDGLTATLTITGLNTYEKTYALVIPEIGLNEAKTVSFTTKAEAPATKVKQNGVNINGYTNMPLSFSPTIEFVYGIADATDLTGITIARKDGASTTATIAVTQGAATDGTFTTAKAVIANLERGTEYVVSVPAYGNNEAKSITFTTVASPYYVYDDFDGFVANDWYQDNAKNGLLNALVDIDADGIGDALCYTAFKHPSLIPTSTIDMSAAGEIVYETRAKFKANSDSYLNADNSLKTGDANNGGLIRIRGTAASSWIRFRTDAEGNLTYGEVNGDLYNTGYKIYSDKWYTFRITVASNGKTFKMTVIDEDGNFYDGPFQSTSYGGTVMKGFKAVEFPYGSFVDSTIDYFKLWDNSNVSVTETAITYGEGTDLNGAGGFAIDGTVDATVTFASAITAADMAKIYVTGGLNAEKTLSDDGLSVAVTISGMDYDGAYALVVPVIGTNSSEIAFFNAEPTPAPVITYGEEADDLNGKADLPKAFTGNLTLKWAIDESADLSGITIDGGKIAVKYLDENTVRVDISDLDFDTWYTITVPAIGNNIGTTIKFRTYDGFMFRTEFNGDGKDYGYTLAINETLSNVDTTSAVSDGMLAIAKSPTAHTTAMYFDEKADAADVDEFVVDMRVRWHANVGAREDGLLHAGKKLLRVRYGSTYAQMALSAMNGKLAYGGSGDNAEAEATVTDYDLKENMWYTIKFVYHKATNTMDLTLTPDEGEAFTVTDAPTGFHKMQGVTDIQFSYRYNIYTDVDYIRIYENKEGEFATPVFSKAEVKEGEEIEIDADYINYTGTDDISLIVALYGADGKMTRILEPETVNTAIGANELSTKVTPVKGETKVRAFVWKGGLAKMIPMTLPNQIGE
ncbi:MAG: hypothetical protein J6A69_01955, partial [Clostridia bacterium]|nr:hypothetical protein [Clostridia bacterium]